MYYIMVVDVKETYVIMGDVKEMVLYVRET